MKILSLRNIEIKFNLAILPLLLLFFLNDLILEFLLVFHILLIHELGHILVAYKCNVKIREINIFPLGAIIKFQYLLGIDPFKEIIISFAGPLVNLIIVFLSLLLTKYNSSFKYMNLIIESNLLLFIINMLPIIPLDGGRILKSILYMKKGFRFSNIIMTIIGKITLTLIAFIGIFYIDNIAEVFILIIIIIYLIRAAKKEKEMAAFILIQSISRKPSILKNNKIMKAHFLVAMKNTKLKSILDIILPNRYNIIFIINYKGEFLGRVTEEVFFDGIINYGCNENIEKLLIIEKK